MTSGRKQGVYIYTSYFVALRFSPPGRLERASDGVLVMLRLPPGRKVLLHPDGGRGPPAGTAHQHHQGSSRDLEHQLIFINKRCWSLGWEGGRGGGHKLENPLSAVVFQY